MIVMALVDAGRKMRLKCRCGGVQIWLVSSSAPLTTWSIWIDRVINLSTCEHIKLMPKE